MTLNQLRIFVVVGRRLNVTEASRELHISQSAVSHQLKLLEEACGLKLYKKIAHGIKLTDEGQRYLRDAQSVLLQAENLKRKYNRNLKERQPERLNVGGTDGRSALFLPSLIAAFKKAHPQMEIHLRTDSSRAIEQMAANSEIEIGIITTPSNLAFLNYELYRQQEYVAFVSSAHPLAKAKSCTLGDLLRFPFALRKRTVGRMSRAEELLTRLEKDGAKLDVALYSNSAEAVKGAVRSGIGVGFLYRDYVDSDARQGSLKIIRVPELERKSHSYIIYRKQDQLSEIGRQFLHFLREWPN